MENVQTRYVVSVVNRRKENQRDSNEGTEKALFLSGTTIVVI